MLRSHRAQNLRRYVWTESDRRLVGAGRGGEGRATRSVEHSGARSTNAPPQRREAFGEGTCALLSRVGGGDLADLEKESLAI